MKRIKITFYPSAEAEQMLRLLAGIRGVSCNSIVVESVEKFLKEALENGDFNNVSNVVEAFERTAA